MTIPVPSFGPDGFIVPAEADILIAVKEEINAAFGNKLNMADETPQGQIAVSQTAAIGNANDSFVFLSQQFDPAYNSGRYQDAIARIYFIWRIGSRPTAVVCACGGRDGVVIEAGSLARSSDGIRYVATETRTIDATGTVDVTFACTVDGPVPCPAHTVTTIYQAVNGWDSIDNATEGVLGRDTEKRAEFEERRFASVANNARGTLPAVLGSVLELTGVLDAYVTENVENTPQTIGGVLLGPKSLYVAAVGGDATEIADAIWRKKAPGCGYNGNTNVTIYDDNAGYLPPYPAYSVAFQRPTGLAILFYVDVQNNAYVPNDAEAQIQEAVINAFIGADGGPRVRIGSEVFAARFYNAILALGAWAQLRSVKIGSTVNPDAVTTGSIAGANMTITAIGSGAVEIGDTVIGTGVLDGTRVLSQSSGSAGSTGVYVVSIAQIVTSRTLTMAQAARDTIQPHIDHAPTVVAANIVVDIS